MKSPVSENLKYIQNEKPGEQQAIFFFCSRQFVYSNFQEQKVFPNIGRFLSFFLSKKKKRSYHITTGF